MRGGEHLPIAFDLRYLACAQAGSNSLQRVTSRNLRAVPTIDESVGTRLHRSTRGGALGAQVFEAHLVDGLERQAVLETRLRRRIEIPGRFERPLALEFGAVTLKTERRGLRLARTLPWLQQCTGDQ